MTVRRLYITCTGVSGTFLLVKLVLLAAVGAIVAFDAWPGGDGSEAVDRVQVAPGVGFAAAQVADSASLAADADDAALDPSAVVLTAADAGTATAAGVVKTFGDGAISPPGVPGFAPATAPTVTRTRGGRGPTFPPDDAEILVVEPGGPAPGGGLDGLVRDVSETPAAIDPGTAGALVDGTLAGVADQLPAEAQSLGR